MPKPKKITVVAKASPRSNDQVQSLVRALTLLNSLSETDEGITLTELAQQVGLTTSTAHRLLTTLQQERYVQFNGERRVWSVGVQAFVTGNAFLKTRNLVASARAQMRLLMEDSEETVNLAVEDQFEAIYLAQVECRQMMRVFARPGGRVPLHCSGVGKALLMAMPESALARVLHQRGLPRLTAKTISSPSMLRKDLERARERGYALDDEEHAVGLRCIAAPIFNENAEALAAISLSGPMARIADDRIPLLGDLVRQKADAISLQIGGILPSWRRSR
ncbi:MAG: winged helix-turn-helix transcriptional regulator [Rhodanobacter sp.]|nr:MAG: winged helix-turn-helix transcriptional regulator [Rhodanobacter sp.]